MTKLDLHVRRSLFEYPTIFPSRAAVLAHLYLVLGNGYDWEDGVLVKIHAGPAPTEMSYDDLSEEKITQSVDAVFAGISMRDKMRVRLPSSI